MELLLIIKWWKLYIYIAFSCSMGKWIYLTKHWVLSRWIIESDYTYGIKKGFEWLTSAFSSSGPALISFSSILLLLPCACFCSRAFALFIPLVWPFLWLLSYFSSPLPYQWGVSWSTYVKGDQETRSASSIWISQTPSLTFYFSVASNTIQHITSYACVHFLHMNICVYVCR